MRSLLLVWFLLTPQLMRPAMAQSSIRCWGLEGFFDTESRAGPATFIAAGPTHTAVVRADGRLYVQGKNAVNFSATCEVPRPPAGRTFVDCGVGAGFGVGRLSDGSLMAWGAQGYGVVSMDIPALPPGLRYVDYSVGVNHALFLRSDGVVVSMGENAYGQSTVPNVPPGLTVEKVYAGPGTSALLLSDGSLVCWGDNGWGQCNVPPLPSGMTYTDVSLGYFHSLAFRSDGSLVAFGASAFGLNTVPQLPAGVSWTLAAAGAGFSVAVRSDGVVTAWGTNFYGALNVPNLPAVPIVQLDAGSDHTVVRLADGRVIAWGWDDYFRTNLHTLPGAFSGQPSAVYEDFAAGGAHVLALLSDGTPVGFGTTIDDRTRFPALPPGMSYTKVFCSFWRSGALRSDGQLVLFGYSGPWSVVPPLPNGVTYVDAALATDHTVALRSDGEVVAFGLNHWNVSTIPPLPPGTSYLDIGAHYARTLLLRSDDVLMSLGQFPPNSPPPTAPPGVHFTQVACSRNYDAALRSDGEVELWGSMGPWYYLQPPRLPWGVYYVEIAGGSGTTLLRRSDGRVRYAGGGGTVMNAPFLDPGTSYVQLDMRYSNAMARVGPTATYVGIGHGCAGSLQPARLVPRDTPRIGRDFVLNVFDLPADLALLGMSFAPPPVPVPLASLGMPGCEWHIALDGMAALVGAAGSARFTLPIPDVPQLVGQRFQHQAVVLDPGHNGAFGIGAVVSDAMEGVIGRP
ncbi:MAG TPA: hypothetical protein ENI87_15095 [bacterium]|nr:hypothetical protein [bacterium]